MSTGGSGESLGPLERVPQPKVGKTKAAEVLDRDEMRAEARGGSLPPGLRSSLVIGREVKEFAGRPPQGGHGAQEPDPRRRPQVRRSRAARRPHVAEAAIRRCASSRPEAQVRRDRPEEGRPAFLGATEPPITSADRLGHASADQQALLLRQESATCWRRRWCGWWSEITKKHIQ